MAQNSPKEGRKSNSIAQQRKESIFTAQLDQLEHLGYINQSKKSEFSSEMDNMTGK